MLSIEAIGSAFPLTQQLDSLGFGLDPIDNTPLAALVKATRSDMNIGRCLTGELGDVNEGMNTMAYLANARDSLVKESEHDNELDAIVKVAATSLKRHIAFARSVVAPSVNELANYVKSQMAGLSPDKTLGVEVVTWNPAPPYNTDALTRLVEKFDSVPFDPPRLALRLPTLPTDEVLKYLETGVSSLDDKIAEWVAVRGGDFFQQVWEVFFQGEKNPNNDTLAQRGFFEIIRDAENGQDYALAVFLIANRLFEAGPPEGTEQTLQSFETMVVQYRNQAGNRVWRNLEEYDGNSKKKMLVRKVDRTKVIVFEPVYREWVTNGNGSNEILFGLLLSKQMHRTVDQINEAAGDLRAVWERQSSVIRMTEENNRFNRVKEFLHNGFLKQLDDIPAPNDESADDSIEVATAGEKAKFQKLFSAELATIRMDEIDNLYGLCLRLVCRSRFYQTDAEVILQGMENVKRKNPSIDVREAATVSITDYVTGWVACQFRVSSLNAQ